MPHDRNALLAVSSAQFALLAMLAARTGVVWLRDEQATVAIGMAATPYLALGPDQNGAVSAVITSDGRSFFNALLAQAEAEAGGQHVG